MGIPKRLGVALAAALVAGLVVASAPPASAGLPPSEWVIGPMRKVAFITFDGKSHPNHFRDVLETLTKKNARASFFIPGSWIRANRERVRLLRVAGHRLGNRGSADRRFTRLSNGEIRAQIERGEDALRSVGARPKPFLRMPDGRRNLRVLRVAGSMGYRSVRWTHSAGAGLADRVRRRVVRRAQAGSIISLKIWRTSHRNALGGIIDGLRRRGFRLPTIGRLENAHAVRWDVTLRAGSSGSEVYYLERRLRRNSYPVGRVRSSFGYATLQAVYAFEKANRMTRDGVVPPRQMTKISIAGRPWVRDRSPKAYVEIDISRQVLFEVRDGVVRHTLPISSGNEEYYEVDGQRYKAHTPRGNFRIERKIPGWRTSRLGRLWYPSYFVGGYAIHGSTSVPTYPASHGCVRIPMYATKPFYRRNPIGRPVFVHD